MLVSWDLAEILNHLGRTEESFEMSNRARLGWQLFISLPAYFNWQQLHPMWMETAGWYEELGRSDVAIGLYMELLGLSSVRGYPQAEW
jgi:hypothetical protein